MIQDIANLIKQVDALSKNGQNIGRLRRQSQPGSRQHQPRPRFDPRRRLTAKKPAAAEPIKGITMSEKAIDVTMAEGRVYHETSEFLIDDVPVRSNGSVGFDETLNLVIEIPDPTKMGRRQGRSSRWSAR